VARRLTLVLTVLVALAGAASAEAKTLVRYEVGGGIAGRADRLVVEHNGSAHQTGDSGKHEFKVSSERLRGLKRALKAARFASLQRRYAPDRVVVDGMSRLVRYRGRTVTVSTGADVPKRLERVLSRLGRIMRD
jgi:hypothetical protein